MSIYYLMAWPPLLAYIKAIAVKKPRHWQVSDTGSNGGRKAGRMKMEPYELISCRSLPLACCAVFVACIWRHSLGETLRGGIMAPNRNRASVEISASGSGSLWHSIFPGSIYSAQPIGFFGWIVFFEGALALAIYNFTRILLLKIWTFPLFDRGETINAGTFRRICCWNCVFAVTSRKGIHFNAKMFCGYVLYIICNTAIVTIHICDVGLLLIN